MEDQRPREALEERIGYRFEDVTLLHRALVHRSWAHDHAPPVADNERLEFLGDAVLGLVVAEHLFETFEDDEGQLTRARASVVRRETLAEHARALGLGEEVLLGRGEESSGGRDKDSILADAFEALIGAVYRDGGLVAARAFIATAMAEVLAARDGDGGIQAPRDARTLLQEELQRCGLGTPKYRIVATEGPPHAPTWTLEVLVGGRSTGRGTGRSKQEAAREAARQALDALDAGGGDRAVAAVPGVGGVP